MPPSLKILPSELLDKSIDLILFDKDDKLLAPSNPVWKTLSEHFNNKISAKHIWLIYHTNRYDLKSRYRQARDLSVEAVSTNVSIDELNNTVLDTSTEVADSSYSIIPTDKQDSSKEKFPTLRGIVTLSSTEWEKMSPKNINYRDKRDIKRKYTVLQKGWTDILYNAIWNQLRIPCPYAFKRGVISDNAGCPYLKISAVCHECHSNFKAHVLNKPCTGDGITLQVTTSDTRGVGHITKRRLAGDLREKIGEELSSQKAATWQRNKANECITFGEPEPGNLYSKEVLRKVKQEVRDKTLVGGRFSNVIESIENLMDSVEFANVVKAFSLEKFHLMYWTVNQVSLYKEARKRNRISLYLDATGSVVNKIIYDNRQSGYIFLYQGVLSIHNTIVPVVQMVSEVHNSNIITYWLREWLRSGIPEPTEVVTDFSLALIHAVSMSFNGIELSMYNNICFDIVSGSFTHALPRTYLRIDVAHLINCVCRWKCFKNTRPEVKDFYVRCIGILTKCTDLRDFTEILLSILVVAQSTSDGENKTMNILTPCENREKFLLERIRTFESKQYVEGNDEILDETIELVQLDANNAVQKLINNLQEKSAEECCVDGTRLNPYYLKSLVPDLCRISKYFLIWTNVMTPFYQSQSTASSAYVENYFNELKNSILQQEHLPMRVDKFFVRHVRSIQGTAKLTQAMNVQQYQNKNCKMSTEQNLVQVNDPEHVKSIDNETIIESSKNQLSMNTNIRTSTEALTNSLTEGSDVSLQVHKIEETTCNNINMSTDSVDKFQHLNEMENWRGRATKKNKNGRYLQPCPEIGKSKKRLVSINAAKLRLLKNGGLQPPIKINAYEGKMRLIYTCPFDAVIQSLTTAYLDFTRYTNFVDSSDNPTLLLVKSLVLQGAKLALYKERAAILLRWRKEPKNNVLDCSGNVIELADYLFHNVPSVTKIITCKTCDTSSMKSLVTLCLQQEEFYKTGFPGIEVNIAESLKGKANTCKICKTLNSTSFVTGPHLILDVEFTNFSKHDDPDWTGVTYLNYIPTSVNVLDNNYTLCAVICYRQPKIVDSVGHYFTYCRRFSGTWELHDGLKESIINVNGYRQKVTATALVYVKN